MVATSSTLPSTLDSGGQNGRNGVGAGLGGVIAAVSVTILVVVLIILVVWWLRRRLVTHDI